MHVADGDASPNTIRSYHSNSAQFVIWCEDCGIDPARATETDLLRCRKHLSENYTGGTVGVKLAAIRRLYEAAVWRGLRLDNPTAGLTAPKDRTERSERVKFLSLDGLRRLLGALQGNTTAAVRDRAMLALMGQHGLRVSEVAGLTLDSADLEACTLRVLGKGRKERTVYLTDFSSGTICQWLERRSHVANEGESALFVSLDRCTGGSRMSSRAIRWKVRKYLREIELEADGVSCHSLRHSAAAWARAGGARLDSIGAMLGHASVTTT